MKGETVNSLSEFIEHVEFFSIVSDLVLFRGQNNRGNLLPGIARENPQKDTTKRERLVLEQLRLMGDSFLGERNLNQWDLLVIAQHFGLKTRLLDWTTNPLAALWFACEKGAPGKDSFVYSLEADALLIDEAAKRGPFAQSETRVFQPKLNNPRIIAQHGWFTVHRYSKSTKKFVALEKNPKIRESVTEFRVPSKRRKEIRESLDRHGINERALFPDLEGLCRYLNWKHRA